MAQATAKRKQSQRPNGSAYKLIHSTQGHKDISWGQYQNSLQAYSAHALQRLF